VSRNSDLCQRTRLNLNLLLIQVKVLLTLLPSIAFYRFLDTVNLRNYNDHMQDVCKHEIMTVNQYALQHLFLLDHTCNT
jgi:hypothetical protein